MSDFNSADYLTQLLKDKKQLAAFPNVFMHLERLLDEGKSKNFLSSSKKQRLTFMLSHLSIHLSNIWLIFMVL